MEISNLKDTAWLAKRLGLSVTTIERIRARNSSDLPPCIVIGHSIRYDEVTVEAWIKEQLSTSKNKGVNRAC